jgi:hypothetical protein
MKTLLKPLLKPLRFLATTLLFPLTLITTLHAEETKTTNGWIATLESALKKKQFLIVQIDPQIETNQWTIIPLKTEKTPLSKNILKKIEIQQTQITNSNPVEDLLNITPDHPPQNELPNEIRKAIQTHYGDRGSLDIEEISLIIETEPKPSQILADEIVETTHIKTKTEKTLALIETLP